MSSFTSLSIFLSLSIPLQPSDTSKWALPVPSELKTRLLWPKSSITRSKRATSPPASTYWRSTCLPLAWAGYPWPSYSPVPSLFTPSGAATVLGVPHTPTITARDIWPLLFGTAGLLNSPTSTRRCTALRDVTMWNTALIWTVSMSCRCLVSQGRFTLLRLPSSIRASLFLWHLPPRSSHLPRAPLTLSPLKAVDFIYVLCFLCV